MTWLHTFLFFSASFSIWQANAARNIQVGDDDGIFVYEPAGAWIKMEESMDIGGTHRVTELATATATLRFTGTAVYFYAPLWPYAVGTTVSLDGGPSTLLDLQDHAQPLAAQSGATSASHIVWQATGLENQEHVLRVTPGNGLAVVDSVVYTVPDPQDLLPTTSSTLTTTTSSTTDGTPITSTDTPRSNATTTPGTKRGLSIAIGIVCGIFALLVLIFAWRWWRRREIRKAELKTLHYEAPAETSNESYPSVAQMESSTAAPPSRPSIFVPPPIPIPSVSPANGKSPTSPLRHPAGSMPSSPLNPATASSRKAQLLSTIHESARLNSRRTPSAGHTTTYSAASSEAGRSRTSIPTMTPRDSVTDWNAPGPSARAIQKSKGKAPSTASSRSS